MMSAGLVSSSASSLERRYGFSKTRLGVLLAFTDVISCVCAMPIGHLGSRPRAHKGTWLSVMYVISAVGALLFAVPHFIGGTYRPFGGFTGTPICSATSVSDPP